MKKQVSVIGAGQMGSGIAQVFATAGYPVKIFDISDEILEKARQNIQISLEKLYSKNLISANPKKILDRICFENNFSALAGSKIFVESAFEDFSIKIKIFKQLSPLLSPNCYVASNTSS